MRLAHTSPGSSIDTLERQIKAAPDQRRNRHAARILEIIADCMEAGKDRPERLAVRPRDPASDHPTFILTDRTELKDDIPTLLLDADADPLIVCQFFNPGPVERVLLRPRAEIIQAVDHLHSRTMLKRDAVRARLRWIIEAEVFPLPSHWVAARVNDTGLYINGLAFKPSDWSSTGTPIIRIQNLTDPKKEFNYATGDFPDEVMVRDGDLLVSWSATLDAFRWRNTTGVLNQHIFRVIPNEKLATKSFLLLLLKNAIREMADSEHAHGLVMSHINRGPFLNHVVLVPPLAEQHRIVAKVEELMALLDRLEAARAAREETRTRLTAATLSRLTEAEADTPTAARFALQTLPALTTRPDQIKTLRQSILNLAVRGKLVEQDPTDGSASDLLKRIGGEIAAYSTSERISQTLPATVEAYEQEFDLPKGWSWTRLCGLFNVITDGDHQPPPKADAGIAFLTIGNVTTGKLDFAGCRTVPTDYFEALPRYRTPQKGDILYTVVGATYGRPALVETDRPFCVQRHIAIMKPSESMDVRFLLHLLASPMVYDQATRGTTGTAQPTIALRPLRNFVVALPPLAEQHRIVAKVEELMSLCDRLERALEDATTTRARLLDATLREVLAHAQEAA